MLQIKKYDFKPQGIGQGEACVDWHGNNRLLECLSPEFNTMIDKREREVIERGYIPERIFERYAMASIVESIKRDDAVFVEVGAGYGEWTLAFDGLIENKVIQTGVKSACCIGIEPDHTHYEWLKTHMDCNGIKGIAIRAVVSDLEGIVRINNNARPDYDYGQTILNHGVDKKTVFGLVRYIMRDTMKVRSYTLDHIMSSEGGHIDLVHIDVQGAEDKVIKGADGLISSGNIDYMIIGTHGDKKHSKVKSMLESAYEFVVDIKPNSIDETNVGKVETQDGILVCERKGI